MIGLADTAAAAHALRLTPGAFRQWARRRQLHPVACCTRSRRALYDLDAVLAATRPTTKENR